MTALLRLFVLSTSLLLSAASVAKAAPAALVDPNLVFLEQSDVPRDYQRAPEMDQLSANNGIITAIRNHKNGDWLFQQIVWSTGSEDSARDVGGAYIGTLAEKQNGEFRDFGALGDQAVIGSGVDATGQAYHVVVFRRGPLACAILWTHNQDADLEAESVALASKMDARARAAVSS